MPPYQAKQLQQSLMYGKVALSGSYYFYYCFIVDTSDTPRYHAEKLHVVETNQN